MSPHILLFVGLIGCPAVETGGDADSDADSDADTVVPRLRVVNGTWEGESLDAALDGAPLTVGLEASTVFPAEVDFDGFGAPVDVGPHTLTVAIDDETLAASLDAVDGGVYTAWVHGSAAGGYALGISALPDDLGASVAVSVLHGAVGVGPIDVTLWGDTEPIDLVRGLSYGEIASNVPELGDPFMVSYSHVAIGPAGTGTTTAHFSAEVIDRNAFTPPWYDAAVLGDPQSDAGLSVFVLTARGWARAGADVDVGWRNVSPSLTAASGGLVTASFCTPEGDCESSSAALFADAQPVLTGHRTRLRLTGRSGEVLYEQEFHGSQFARRTTFVSVDRDGEHEVLRFEDDGVAPTDGSTSFARLWNLSSRAGTTSMAGGDAGTGPVPFGGRSPFVALAAPGPHDFAFDFGANGDVDRRWPGRDPDGAVMEVFLVDQEGAPLAMRRGYEQGAGAWLAYGTRTLGERCDGDHRCRGNAVCRAFPLDGDRATCAPLVLDGADCPVATTWVDLGAADYLASLCVPTGTMVGTFDLVIDGGGTGATTLEVGTDHWTFDPLAATSEGYRVWLDGSADGLGLSIELWGLLYETGQHAFPAEAWAAYVPPTTHLVSRLQPHLLRDDVECLAYGPGSITLDAADVGPGGRVEGTLTVPVRPLVERREAYAPTGPQ